MDSRAQNMGSGIEKNLGRCRGKKTGRGAWFWKHGSVISCFLMNFYLVELFDIGYRETDCWIWLDIASYPRPRSPPTSPHSQSHSKQEPCSCQSWGQPLSAWSGNSAMPTAASVLESGWLSFLLWGRIWFIRSYPATQLPNSSTPSSHHCHSTPKLSFTDLLNS